MHEFQVDISGLTFTIPGKILHRHASHICACKWTGECSVVVFELWYVLHSTSNGKGSSNFTHFVVLILLMPNAILAQTQHKLDVASLCHQGDHMRIYSFDGMTSKWFMNGTWKWVPWINNNPSQSSCHDEVAWFVVID